MHHKPYILMLQKLVMRYSWIFPTILLLIVEIFLRVVCQIEEDIPLPAVHNAAARKDELRERFSQEFIKTFQDMYFRGDGEAAANFFAQELMWKRDSRKEIEISCPGQETPIVSIRSLDDKETAMNSHDEEDFEIELDDDGNPFHKKVDYKVKECLSLKLTGKNFDFSFSIDCPT